MTDIEKKEIRGITLKQIVVTGLCIISCVASTVLFITNVINNQTKNSEKIRLIEIRLETQEVELKTFQTNQNTIINNQTKTDVQVQELMETRKNK